MLPFILTSFFLPLPSLSPANHCATAGSRVERRRPSTTTANSYCESVAHGSCERICLGGRYEDVTERMLYLDLEALDRICVRRKGLFISRPNLYIRWRIKHRGYNSQYGVFPSSKSTNWNEKLDNTPRNITLIVVLDVFDEPVLASGAVYCLRNAGNYG